MKNREFEELKVEIKALAKAVAEWNHFVLFIGDCFFRQSELILNLNKRLAALERAHEMHGSSNSDGVGQGIIQ